MQPTETEIEELYHTPVMRGLDRAAFDTLVPHIRRRQYHRGDLLFLRGDPADRLFFVASGWVKVYRDNPDGDQSVLHIILPGETFTEPAVFGLGFYPATAESAVASVVLEIPANILKQMLTSNPTLALRVIGAMAMRLRSVIGDMEKRQYSPTHIRLACFLHNLLPRDHDGAEAQIDLPFDKSLIAARLGMRPESLSRAFGKLRKEGIRVSGHTVHIEDCDHLAEICGDDF